MVDEYDNEYQYFQLCNPMMDLQLIEESNFRVEIEFD